MVMKFPLWLRRVISWATESRFRFLPGRMKGQSVRGPRDTYDHCPDIALLFTFLNRVRAIGPTFLSLLFVCVPSKRCSVHG